MASMIIITTTCILSVHTFLESLTYMVDAVTVDHKISLHFYKALFSLMPHVHCITVAHH